jgi:hypothetical protein
MSKMAEFIRLSKRIERVDYEHLFAWTNTPGSGFAFPCDEHGNVKLDDLSPRAAENYRKCVSGEFDVVDEGIVRYPHAYLEPAAIRCCCGRELELPDGWLNTCECGRDYNGCGQLLAPRSQWGEETGESLADMLNPSLD